MSRAANALCSLFWRGHVLLACERSIGHDVCLQWWAGQLSCVAMINICTGAETWSCSLNVVAYRGFAAMCTDCMLCKAPANALWKPGAVSAQVISIFMREDDPCALVFGEPCTNSTSFNASYRSWQKLDGQHPPSRPSDATPCHSATKPRSSFPSLSNATALLIRVARRAHRRMDIELEFQTLSVTFQALPVMRGAAQSARVEAPLVHVSLLLDLQQLAPAATLPAR